MSLVIPVFCGGVKFSGFNFLLDFRNQWTGLCLRRLRAVPHSLRLADELPLPEKRADWFSMSDLFDHLQLWTEVQKNRPDQPLLLMLSGAQGIGKSTAVTRLTASDPSIVSLSIDDFYLPRADRLRLAGEVHPLFETRGPPGTHDLPLIHDCLDQLLSATKTCETRLPVFSKKLDERLPAEQWRVWKGRPRIIFLEGWLMGVLADDNSPSDQPMNPVEAEDTDGIWRGFQETYLRAAYARLWDRADAFCHIKAPSFETVLNWRIQQEAENQGVSPDTLSAERVDWVRRFILHYERLTRRMLCGDHRPGRVVCVDVHRRVID